jgi:hypothetical protein
VSDLPHIPLEELEDLALGALAPERAAQIEEHARACAGCARELAWARAERLLLERRAASAPALSPQLWQGVQARLSASPPTVVSLDAQRARRRRSWLGAAAALAAAAAVAVIATTPRTTTPVSRAVDEDEAADPEAAAALDRAEGEYRSAVSVLEAALQKRDPQAAQSLQKIRAGLADARAVPPADLQSRLRVLSGYSAYLRTLQRAVDSEEAAP